MEEKIGTKTVEAKEKVKQKKRDEKAKRKARLQAETFNDEAQDLTNNKELKDEEMFYEDEIDEAELQRLAEKHRENKRMKHMESVATNANQQAINMANSLSQAIASSHKEINKLMTENSQLTKSTISEVGRELQHSSQTAQQI